LKQLSNQDFLVGFVILRLALFDPQNYFPRFKEELYIFIAAINGNLGIDWARSKDMLCKQGLIPRLVYHPGKLPVT